MFQPLLRVAALFMIQWWSTSTASAHNRAPCHERGSSVVVDLDRSILWLCEDNKSQGHYRVAFGQGGVGKRKEGDKKTPIGTYTLGKARRSSGYYRFMPVGYPTPEQRAEGYTGSAIGIHGPKNGFERLGFLNSRINWTLGCIAVATPGEFDEIEAWTESHGAQTIHLLPALD